MCFHYQLYGLRLRANVRLGPLPLAGPGPFELMVDLAGPPLAPEPAVPPHAAASHIRIWREGDRSELRYTLGDQTLAFLITDRGTRLRASWSAGVEPADVLPFLIGPALGLALHLRGSLCFHAAAALVGGRALALMGSSGAGKSTTTAALVRAGYRLLSDDIVALDDDNQLVMRPAYPALRMSAASALAMEAFAAGIYPLWSDATQENGRRYVDLAGTAYVSPDPAPLGAMYLLAGRQADCALPFITPLSPKAALPILMEQLYTRGGMLPPEREQAFRRCAQLCARLPVRLVHAPNDLARLPELVAALAADLERCS